MRIAVLGATGFIGSHLTAALAARQLDAVAVVRRASRVCPLPSRVVPELADSAVLAQAIADADAIVHLADESGRFATGETAQPIATSLVAALSGKAGASFPPRLIFSSSIYARLDENGQFSPYGARKRRQEQILLGAMPAIGLRLPPVYGEGCGGSFAMLARATKRGLLLPLGCAVAPRSFLSVDNLCDLIITLLTASDAAWTKGAPAVYEPEDAVRISTRDLAIALAKHHGRKPRLVAVRRDVIAAAATLLGRQELVRGAFDTLAATGNAELARIFGWRPAAGLPETLATTQPSPAGVSAAS